MRSHGAATNTPPRGGEQGPLSGSKTAISKTGRTKSGTLSAGDTPTDPGLARLIEIWPRLSKDTQATLLRAAGVATEPLDNRS